MNRRGFLKALGIAPVAAALSAVVAAVPAEIAAEPVLSADPNITSNQFLRGDGTWHTIDVLPISTGGTGYVTVTIAGAEHHLPCL